MKLIDTCEIIRLFEENKEKELLKKDVAVCSFNRDEATILSHRHSINVHLRHKMRKFFESNDVVVIDVPVKPGNRVEEMTFVQSVNPLLLKIIPDPSDAVLAACALQHDADIVTRDRYHLYTTQLESLFSKNGINVSKKI